MSEDNRHDDEIDFFALGTLNVKNEIQNLNARAEFIGEKFGPEAKEMFELGVASYMLTQESTFIEDEYELNLDFIRGTKLFGKENLRNNSYFGYDGISEQYSEEEYNEPDDPNELKLKR